jgi:LmbE family N-acetylglucosaminyl deacetylase
MASLLARASLWWLVFFSGYAAAEPVTSGDIVQELRNFRELGSVLYIAAHPDDENNLLLPYLARGRALRTGYLSLTRGDGGQNLIGTELGDGLGVIRTQELLAARRIDGAQQFFSRAKDFGFSKDSADTLRRWDRTQVLADTVRVIRTFRPDVIVTRFSTIPGGTHGHHTASAVIALEAFKLAGDPSAFPDQLADLKPWQAKRIFWNAWVPGAAPTALPPNTIRLEAGGYDTLLGESFGEIGARGRSMHKSQGAARLGTRGAGSENFQLLAGEPAKEDILDGVDTTWARIPGGADIGPLVDAVITQFNPLNPAASVPALLAIRTKLAALTEDPLLVEKRHQLDHILQACLGLFVETVVAQAQVVPRETFQLKHTAIARSGFPVRWLGARYPNGSHEVVGQPMTLAPNGPVAREASQILPAATPLSHPYWLREVGSEGMSVVSDPKLIGLPETPPAFPVEEVFEVGGQTLVVADEPVQVINDPVRGEIRRRLDVIPPVSLGWSQAIALLSPGETKTVSVEVTAARAKSAGTVQLDGPADWKISPSAQPFSLAAVGARASFSFSITAPPKPQSVQLTAYALIDGVRYDRSRVEIRYDHIPSQLLQSPARIKAVSLDLATRGHAIGYLPGAGDLVAESLIRMGYAVTTLSPANLTTESLRHFDAVVIGVRAFNIRPELDAQMPVLFAYAEQGGNVVIQYNTANGLLSSHFAPYDLVLSGDRITNADAPVSLLAADHPVLTGPNRITSADFDGWVQERARYLPRTWGSEFIPILAAGDAGEKPLNGALLVAKHGRGYFVYTSLSFFRELPAGVPGAYRLFANLVSLGK